MRSTRIAVALIAATTSLGIAACGSGSSTSSSGIERASDNPAPTPVVNTGSAKTLVGAGSTLVAPLVSQWQPTYDKTAGVAVTYGAIGSGGGIEQITARTVDFGASDAPLTPDQFAAAKGVVQIPWALAATDVAYHVKGVPNGLKLTGPVLADIYLGKITSWNTPQIAALNPGVTLPATKITPVYRSDGSGDTFAFTNYLSQVSSEFRSKVGNSTQVSFPVGLGGKGNSGVGGVLQATNGAIAYVAIAYVLENKLDFARIENAAGRFPVPGVPSISAAAEALKTIPANNEVSIVNPPASAAGAYPISTFTYALVPTHSSKAGTMKAFLKWAITTGQKDGPALDFAPLPARIVAADERTIAGIS